MYILSERIITQRQCNLAPNKSSSLHSINLQGWNCSAISSGHDTLPQRKIAEANKLLHGYLIYSDWKTMNLLSSV